jgi:hypothetical protein
LTHEMRGSPAATKQFKQCVLASPQPP